MAKRPPPIFVDSEKKARKAVDLWFKQGRRLELDRVPVVGGVLRFERPSERTQGLLERGDRLLGHGDGDRAADLWLTSAERLERFREDSPELGRANLHDLRRAARGEVVA